MSYKKIDFKDYPDKTMPVSSQNLNMLQDNLGLYLMPTGGIVEFAGTVAPIGWLMCDGSAVSRTTYAELFEVIGTTFGDGDGSTTFNLPNRKGKTGVGVDNSSDKFGHLGDIYGEEEHQLTIAEMPEHNHNTTAAPDSTAVGTSKQAFLYKYTNATTYACYTQTNGQSKAHNNIQPSIAMNYIIKA